MRILMIAPYPFETPIHGGQLRTANIAKVYRDAGFDVDAIGTSYNYRTTENFIGNIPSEIVAKYALGCPALDDYGVGQACCREDDLFNKLAEKVKTKPDVIHVVQPWLFDFADRLRREKFHSQIPIVYGSQNVEFELKKNILESYYKFERTGEAIQAVRKTELDAISRSDGVICVSADDEKKIAEYNKAPVIVAPNGVSAWHSQRDEIENIRRKMKGNKFALFCGSAHPPNLTGFFDMLDGGLGSLDTGQKIIVVGGIGQMIEHDPRLMTSAKLRERTEILGVIDEGLLHALLDLAQCIILPITQGGGTNLKTAEALWAGHHIVATTVAMRGFEQFMQQRGVEIADESGAFKRAIRKAMEAEPLQLNDDERKARREVLWESYLKGLPDFVEKIARNHK